MNKKTTRAAIINAAENLFSELDYADVTMAQIAKAANVSERTVFKHFPSKPALYFHDRAYFEAILNSIASAPAGAELAAHVELVLVHIIEADPEFFIWKQEPGAMAPELRDYMYGIWQEFEDQLTALLARRSQRSNAGVLDRLHAVALTEMVRSPFWPETLRTMKNAARPREELRAYVSMMRDLTTKFQAEIELKHSRATMPDVET